MALMVIAIPALLGFTALAIDVARLVVVAQSAQDIADAAALAGAGVLPEHSAADTQISSIVAANQGDGKLATVSITPGNIQFLVAGEDAPGYGQLEPGADAVKVVATAQVPYIFARILGMHTAQVSRTAIAISRELGGEACIFSYDSDANSDGIRLNGSGGYIDGNIHSNSTVRMNGSGHTVTGTLEYVTSYTINGSGHSIGTIRRVGIEPYPCNYEWEDYLPYDSEVPAININGSGKTIPGGGRVHVTGDISVNGSGHHFTEHTTYLVDGNVTINGSGTTMDYITIIAKGTILFNGSSTGSMLHTNEPGLLLLSTATGNAITYNGSGHAATGTIFAPNGDITFNGSGQHVLNGALVAQHITANGSGFTIRGVGATSATRQVALIG